MFGNLTGWHLLVILAIVLLLFGAPKLPGLAKSLGQSMRIFRGEVKAMKEDDSAPGATPPVDDAAAAPTDASVSRPATTSTEPHPKP
ncbi:twin-arginine translocase TatA/TatE family subunit [Diaminobutyricibacter tongyongensis]|uniref:Sec-independent protein translocase protein TatA n=1 Tax=Leifsonia tongyongensis TaxID=1268043 RepID=A0A6L9XXK9_9MICO|nr:Sec-independent protein translocase subunit TatA [Diaminobutyricibacter tongyongensis]NEN06159.1 twin-arginine translocase TatA/TatE family subunit [Diaminobutyricibacter tongyongensis]